MLWFKVKSAIYAHRKTRKIPREPITVPTRTAAMGTWLLAAAWVAQHETDGFIPAEEVERFDPDLSLAKHLVSAGFFEETEQDAEPGYCLHDWLEEQRSAAELEEFREAEAERKRRWRQGKRRAATGPGPDGGGPDGGTTVDVPPSVPPGQTNGHPVGQTASGTASETAGVRSLSEPLEQSRAEQIQERTSSSPSSRAAAPTEDAATEGDPVIEELCNLLLASIIENGYKPVPTITKAWRRDMRLLVERDERSPEKVRRMIAWVSADEFWSPNVRSPGKLRLQWDRLAAKANAQAGYRRNGLAVVPGGAAAARIPTTTARVNAIQALKETP